MKTRARVWTNLFDMGSMQPMTNYEEETIEVTMPKKSLSEIVKSDIAGEFVRAREIFKKSWDIYEQLKSVREQLGRKFDNANRIILDIDICGGTHIMLKNAFFKDETHWCDPEFDDVKAETK